MNGQTILVETQPLDLMKPNYAVYVIIISRLARSTPDQAAKFLLRRLSTKTLLPHTDNYSSMRLSEGKEPDTPSWRQ